MSGCCCGCVGCCFCVVDGVVSGSYVIDAPGCPELDGATGSISGPDAGTPTGCGNCVSLPNNSGSHDVPTYVWDDSLPDNGCVPQPGARLSFAFLLRCDRNESNSETDSGTTEACCRNVRLVVVNPGDNSVIRVIPPVSCVCASGAGLMAIFSLAELLPECTTFFSGGVCDGRPTCTQIGDGPGGVCTMAGSTLTFVQAC